MKNYSDAEQHPASYSSRHAARSLPGCRWWRSTLAAAGLVVSLVIGPCESQAADRIQGRPVFVSRIKREPVISSGLAAVGYSRNRRALEVEFRDGSIYRYANVPPALYRQLMSAESKARFYNQHVRRKYPSVRVKPRRRP